MIDIELLRKSPEIFVDSQKKRDDHSGLIEKIVTIDQKWRALTSKIDELRANLNSLSKGKPSEAEIAKNKGIKEDIKVLEADEAKMSDERTELLLQVQNIVDKEAPTDGVDKVKVLKTVSEPKKGKFLSHEELLRNDDQADFDTASKYSGSRFRYLKDKVALAHLKLMLKAFEFAVEKGFTPVIPPVLAKEEAFFGSGWLPFFKDEIFKTDDGLMLSGTSEATLLLLAANKNHKKADLPLRFVGFSTCFRKEAGSYGKDTRGMFRQHQFDKVEMVSIVSPEESKKEQEFLLKTAQEFVEKFDLAYQVVDIDASDLGAPASRKFDIETWFAGEQKYRETHSISSCTDFQARRLRIKDDAGNYLHTLNGTLATERLLLAIIENNQENGSIQLPKELK